MPDYNVVCSNKVNFPGQSGIPSLDNDYIGLPNIIESIYGNSGNVSFRLSLVPVDTSVTITNVNISSKPAYFDISKISQNLWQITQNNTKIFNDEYRFAIFNSNGSLNSVVTEANAIDKPSKSVVRYSPPSVKMVKASFTFSITYNGTNPQTGTPILNQSDTKLITQDIHWDWNPAINKLTTLVAQGSY